MFRVVFVCLGNICRSPMAEAVFKRLIEERGVAGSFEVLSRATSDCEEGNPVYPPAQRLLNGKGYGFTHRSTPLTMSDVKNADYILIMDNLNLRDLTRFTGGRYAEKVRLLGHFLPEKIYIDDPWYTRDFERAYSEIYSSCVAFLEYLFSAHGGALSYDKTH